MPVGGSAAAGQLGEKLGAEDVEVGAQQRTDPVENRRFGGQLQDSRRHDADSLDFVQQPGNRRAIGLQLEGEMRCRLLQTPSPLHQFVEDLHVAGEPIAVDQLLEEEEAVFLELHNLILGLGITGSSPKSPRWVSTKASRPAKVAAMKK